MRFNLKKKKKKKNWKFWALSFVVLALLPHGAWSKNDVQRSRDKATVSDKSCSGYEAEYGPASGSRGTKHRFDYTLTIEENKAFIPPSTPQAFVFINTYDADTHEILSTLKMSYICTGGVITCGLHAPGIGNFPFMGLNKDFSGSGFGNRPAPYVFIIPDMGAKFYHTHWENVTTIHYYNKARNGDLATLSPGLEAPSIWLFQKCTNRSRAK